MKFNINNYVRVKLNDRGKEILKREYEKMVADNPRLTQFESFKEFKLPKEDEDGWSKWQLWSLMETFGGYISLGCVVPFETEIEIMEK